MPRYVALLRAINVGGHTVTMTTLRASFERLGFTEVATYIASGNVLFSATARASAPLERRIADALADEYGFAVATFLRAPQEIIAAAEHPFEMLNDGDVLQVGFLPRALSAAEARAVQQFATPTDQFVVRGRELYWRRQGRVSESTFSNARLERTLKLEATFRSITTVRALAERAAR